ncbi:DUF4190 domain-containing protein [Isoptericola variabilis]|uniref:DUF4190 domain-containing protein n=1 Tax=Isoptericola variabilis (strain 225) TaxID=743718 RepID=F6FSP8_ISOV2|nr:DUF4190 domain-containing protein [Isoptericola variabilis]AEG45210.1 hypothetical protein Isova_2500 [Isoptericola variabilis 225]TWH33975.1 uncharacterized protein DUF4190 [Isoptericola variabilis J7]
MSNDHGDAVDPNDPYRPAPPSGSGSTLPPNYSPAPSGYEVNPTGGVEMPGTGARGAQPPADPDPYGRSGQDSGGGTPPYYHSQTGYRDAPPEPMYAAYGQQRFSRGTDGFAIAALVTGILGMAIIPLVLGMIALSRIGRTGQEGRGLAIAGIVLGVLGTIGWVLAIVFLFAIFSALEQGGYEMYDLGLGAVLTATV